LSCGLWIETGNYLDGCGKKRIRFGKVRREREPNAAQVHDNPTEWEKGAAESQRSEATAISIKRRENKSNRRSFDFVWPDRPNYAQDDNALI
jgi:hypothetical protein